MPASDQHKLYVKNKDIRKLVRDCVAGSDAIKTARRTDSTEQGGIYNSMGSQYLPVPNPDDDSIENQDRYAAYRARATFINFTGYTKDGLMGMVARKPTEIDLHASIKYAEFNVNGSGLSLQGMTQSVIGNLLETGQDGLLVDFPMSAGGTQMQTAGLNSLILQYPAESIINWREQTIDSVKTPVMISLAEEVQKVAADGFSVDDVTYTRVLSLNEDGDYIQRLYNEHDQLLVNDAGEADIFIKKADGSNWKKILFVPVGSENNDLKPDKPTLYDVAEVNVGHYRNSADFEESSFLVGQPTPVFAGLTQHWIESVFKGGVQIGSRAGVMLPEGASASLLQANENQMPSAGMDRKEKQLVKIGAKIISDAGGVETAEASKIKFAGQNSKLGLIIINTELAFNQCFEWMMEFEGSTGENVFNINKQFYEATVDPQLLVAQMQLLERQVIAKTDVRRTLRKGGLLEHDRTDEDIEGEVEAVSPVI
jgi:hypothetical protein